MTVLSENVYLYAIEDDVDVKVKCLPFRQVAFFVLVLNMLTGKV